MTSQYVTLPQDTARQAQLICRNCGSFPTPPEKREKDDDGNEFDFMSCACCNVFFHVVCSGLEQIEQKWYNSWWCPQCFEMMGAHVLHPFNSPHRREWEKHSPNEPLEVGSKFWIEQNIHTINSVPLPTDADMIRTVDDGYEFLRQTTRNGSFYNWNCAYLITNPNGMGMSIPRKEEFSVESVSTLFGKHKSVRVADVYRQVTKSMKVGCFADHWSSNERVMPLNSLSLKYSKIAQLNQIATAPEIVLRDSFIRILTRNAHLFEEGTYIRSAAKSLTYKPIEQIVIWTMAKSYTDFHIDGSGSSVWFHVLDGKKTFLLAPPSPNNLQKFRESELSQETVRWLGNELEDVRRLVIAEGQLLMIPGGWLHAVYTPVDTTAVSGNFLTLDSLSIQLQVAAIEKETQEVTGDESNFPAFEDVIFCAAEVILTQTINDCTWRARDASVDHPELWDKRNLFRNQLQAWVDLDDQTIDHNDSYSEDLLELKRDVLQKLVNAIDDQQRLQRRQRRNARNLNR